MSTSAGPLSTTNGLVLSLDAANIKSYPGTGTSWTDLSNNSNNATLINGPTYDNLNKGSIQFDGTNDYAVIQYNSILDTPNGATFSFWIYPTTTGEFFNRGTSDIGTTPDNPRFYLSTTDKNIYFDWTISGTDRYVTTSVNSYSNNNAWMNIVGTVAVGGRMDVYINGVQCSYLNRVNANTMPNPLVNTNNQIEIGGATWIPRYFGGKISTTSLYNKVLSLSEIMQNFNALRGRYGI